MADTAAIADRLLRHAGVNPDLDSPEYGQEGPEVPPPPPQFDPNKGPDPVVSIENRLLDYATMSNPVQRFARGAIESAVGMPGQVVQGIGAMVGSQGMQDTGESMQPDLLTPAEHDTFAAKAGSAVGSGAGFMVPGMGAAKGAQLLGLGAKGVSIASGVAVGATAAPLEFADGYYSAKANGADDKTAWKAGITQMPSAALEFLGPTERIAKAMARADRATGGAGRSLAMHTFGEIVKSAAGEGTEEAAQQLWGDIVAQDLYDVAPDQDWVGKLKSAAEAAGYGAIGGGVLGAAYAGAQRLQQEKAKDEAPPPADRSAPVYDPVERDLSEPETEALTEWKKARNATTAEVVERPDAEEAVGLARSTGAEVLFVDDDGAGSKQGQHRAGVIILPASMPAGDVLLETASHEALHAMPEGQRKKLITSLKEAFPEAVKAYSAKYAVAAKEEGVKVKGAELDEEATADFVGAVSPIIRRVMTNEAAAMRALTDAPNVMVRAVDVVKSMLKLQTSGKPKNAEEQNQRIEKLAEVRDQIAKGLSPRQRINVAQFVVSEFKKIKAEASKPVKPKSKAAAQKVETALVPAGPVVDNRAAAVQAKGAKKRALSAQVQKANEPYRPSVATGPEAVSRDLGQMPLTELHTRRKEAAASQEYETNIALREAGFTDRERANYDKARRRTRMAQRSLDMSRSETDAADARAELFDSSRRLESYESRLSPEQRSRLRSGEDPEVYDRAIAAREAGATARLTDTPNAEGLLDEERQGLERAVPSTRYSLEYRDAPPAGQDVQQETSTQKATRAAPSELRSDIEAKVEEIKQGKDVLDGKKPLANEDPRVTARRAALATEAILPRDVRTQAAVSAEADAIMADATRMADVIKRGVDHAPLNDAETVALRRYASDKLNDAWPTGRTDDIEQAVGLWNAYAQQRTAQSSTLRSANEILTERERFNALTLTPSSRVRRKLNRAKGARRQAILAAEAKKIERVRFSLAKQGFDPRLLTDDYFQDPQFRRIMANALAEGKGGSGTDWLIAWRRAAMLSGPLTSIRNIAGNTSHVAYDRVLRLAADALVPNTDTKLSDVSEYVRMMFAAHGQAFGEFKTAYRDFYSRGTEGTSLDEQQVIRRGPVLRAVEAVGLRFQVAQDRYFRTVVGSAETLLRARQMQRVKGGTVEQYLTDPEVMDQANADMERALFLDRDGLTRALTTARDWADTYLPLGSIAVPFLATPTKVVQRGGEAAAGPLAALWRDDEKAGSALLGFGMWGAALWIASQFADDDLPLITGSRDERGRGDFQERTAPAYSIRIGDSYHSYQSIEPLSTGMAAMVDGVRDGSPMAGVASFAKAAKDKSFFRSLQAIYDAATSQQDNATAKLARDMLWTPMIPNVIRAPVRASDDEARKELGNPLEMKDLAYSALPVEALAPPLKHDLWGRPVQKDGGNWVARLLSPLPKTGDTADVEKIDLLLAKYYETNPDATYFSAPQTYTRHGEERRDWTEAEYSELARESGRRSIEVLRPWAAEKTELTERDFERIQEVINRSRRQVRNELIRREVAP